jgi:hypothetical protein
VASAMRDTVIIPETLIVSPNDAVTFNHPFRNFVWMRFNKMLHGGLIAKN